MDSLSEETQSKFKSTMKEEAARESEECSMLSVPRRLRIAEYNIELPAKIILIFTIFMLLFFQIKCLQYIKKQQKSLAETTIVAPYSSQRNESCWMISREEHVRRSLECLVEQVQAWLSTQGWRPAKIIITQTAHLYFSFDWFIFLISTVVISLNSVC